MMISELDEDQKFGLVKKLLNEFPSLRRRVLAYLGLIDHPHFQNRQLSSYCPQCKDSPREESKVLTRG